MVEEANILAYDLRQIYAELVGNHLKLIAEHRISKRYPQYFNALEDLETVVNHKFKKGQPEEYKLLRERFIQIANKYAQVFRGKINNSNAISQIETGLRNIEKFLYKVMDGADMFGSKWADDGL